MKNSGYAGFSAESRRFSKWTLPFPCGNVAVDSDFLQTPVSGKFPGVRRRPERASPGGGEPVSGRLLNCRHRSIEPSGNRGPGAERVRRRKAC